MGKLYDPGRSAYEAFIMYLAGQGMKEAGKVVPWDKNTPIVQAAWRRAAFASYPKARRT